jgi:primosomal protein N' (replication factor Y)
MDQARGGEEVFAEVAVNAGQPARMAFTYRVPPGMQVLPGQAVFAPFGPRILQGIVLELASASTVAEARPLSAVADSRPVLDAVHIALARWLSATYLAPLWDCVATCLPPGYGQRSVTMVSPVDVPPLLPVDAKDRAVLHHIGANGQVTLDALREAVPGVTLGRLARLQEAGHLTVAEGLARPAGRPRTETRLVLLRAPAEVAAEAAALTERSPKSVAARLLRMLAERGEMPLREARQAGVLPGHLRRLEEEGWLETRVAQIERDPLSAQEYPERPPLVLTAEQQRAADTIAGERGTYLLHGVTGSGKTEVYLDLVRRVFAEARAAIILVPEIALTPQAVRRYGERFGHTVTAIHSGLGTGELYDAWYRIARGESRLVVGSRKALFSPVPNLGLVVLDEEHEWTYKQVDPQPRYHARDAAEELCRLSGATLVLGSATPDVVTYHRSEQGPVRRVELQTRIAPGDGGTTGFGRLPDVTVVDMREELKAGNRSVFSFALAGAVRRALAAGEQSILFVNRRGSARFVLCRDCGYLPMCTSCELAMGLDLQPASAELRCHHCGKTKRLEERCPRCESPRYRPFGIGTQRIEQLARAEFPDARIARWDSDTASRKGSHERIVSALEAGEIDILVGTQMLAKGLDLPAMMVVGVVDADVGMSLPDYHAQERTFQLLSQVAGRAGRRNRPGTVIIQSYDPEAAPIQCAAAHDYRTFYGIEIAHRRRAGYPPFARLVRLVHRHRNYERGLEEAARVATDLRTRRDAAGRADPDVLGPTPAFIARVRGEYRWQILVRGRDPVRLVGQTRLGERWAVDVDPAGLL